MNTRHLSLPSAQLNRRDFLKTSSTAALVGLGAVACASRQPIAKQTAVVGAHPWVYAATQPNYDITPVLPRIFADMEYAGMEAIELMHTALRPDDAVDRIAALSTTHRLPVVGTSFGGAMWDREQHTQVMQEAELIVPRLAELGGRTLGVSVGTIQWGAKIRKTPEQLDAQATLLRQIDQLCDLHGVVMNLHNHTYEVENELHDLQGTLARLPDAKLGPDLNWLVRGGVDPVVFLKEYQSRIVFLHVRDQHEDGRWSEALGEGDMDYAAIAETLREIQFQGDVIIELAHESDFEPTRPLRESLKISREFVRDTLGR